MASACDGRKWVYRGREWDHKKVAERVLLSEGKDPSELRLEKHPEPQEKVAKTVRRYVDNFVSDLGDIFFDHTFYIKGGGNFRHDVATILPYKDGRETEPEHRQFISDLMVSEYDAKKVYNVEVDDILGILAGEEDTILVHIDKDIEQVPGLHYNPNRKEQYSIDETEGLRRFYKQLMIGDPTDSILGLHGVGPKSTYVKKLEKMETEDEMYDSVAMLYKQRFGSYASKFMGESCILAWMMRDNQVMYRWMSELMNEEWKAFYMNPYKTAVIE